MVKAEHKLFKRWKMHWMIIKLLGWKIIWNFWKESSRIRFSIRGIMIPVLFRIILILLFTRIKCQLLRKLLLLSVGIITNVKMFSFLLNYLISEMSRVKKNTSKSQSMKHLSKKLIMNILLYNWLKATSVLFIAKEKTMM